MESFSATIGSRGYHVYRNSVWSNIAVNQIVEVHKENNAVSLSYEPYCCKITARKIDHIGPVTVGHIPREISRFVYVLLQEGESVTGTDMDTVPKVSPIPEGGLEVPLQLHFTHPKNES